MSVTLYDESKFYQIVATLMDWDNYGLNLPRSPTGGPGHLAHVFGYPAGWKNYGGLARHIFNMVNDIYRANQITYNRQYPKHEVTIASLYFQELANMGHPYGHPVDLYKSLTGLRYNLMDNAGRTSDINKSMEKLDQIIDNLAFAIISSMPEFEESKEW